MQAAVWAAARSFQTPDRSPLSPLFMIVGRSDRCVASSRSVMSCLIVQRVCQNKNARYGWTRVGFDSWSRPFYKFVDVSHILHRKSISQCFHRRQSHDEPRSRQ